MKKGKEINLIFYILARHLIIYLLARREIELGREECRWYDVIPAFALSSMKLEKKLNTKIFV